MKWLLKKYRAWRNRRRTWARTGRPPHILNFAPEPQCVVHNIREPNNCYRV